jgi:uncharacterized protein YcfL
MKFNPFLFKCVVLVAFIIMSLSCCSKVHQPSGVKSNLNETLLKEIVPLDGLDSLLLFDNIVTLVGPPFQVEVSVKSLNKKRPLSLQYKFEFYDKYRRELKPLNNWHFLSLPAAIDINLSGVAISEQAKSWRLIIREAK